MLDFLGIGAQKAGTTWLYEALAVHPEIRFPAGKEVHFWDAKRERGVDWYRSQFAGAPPGTKRGEITPAYAILDAQVVREVRQLSSAVRILYLIRNPIERAWSSALMALGKAEMTPAEASDQWFLDHFHSRGSLARGDYEACLRTWHAEFPREQLLVLRHEMLATDPLALIELCCTHIGVDPSFYLQTRPAILHKRVRAGSGEPIRASLLSVLQGLYASKIDSLGRYLSLDLAAWHDAR
jgi:hypothetical protein